MNNTSDPDVNFYQNDVSNVEANYFLMTEVKNYLKDLHLHLKGPTFKY